MFNEAANVGATVGRVRESLTGKLESFEIVAVDDGSTDDTASILRELAGEVPELVVAGYSHNRGRGAALRAGFAASRGRYVVTIDADLSYGPEHILQLHRALVEDPEIDIVLGSAYMPGGRTEGVSPFRLAVSRVGNFVLSLQLPSRIHTSTCVLRGYRRAALSSLLLCSDGKDIHLEILAKAFSLGMRVREIPAVLKARRRGGSKFKLGPTVLSHLVFGATEKPMALFGVVGLLLLLVGLVSSIYIVHLRYAGALNPTRPLMSMTVLLVLGGAQFLSFGFIALLLSALRRDVHRVQQQLKRLELRHDEADRDAGEVHVQAKD
jgi:glycosyltransferase involved in cell wall biosynthesis